MEPTQNPNEQPQKKSQVDFASYLTPANLSLASLGIGILSFILVFFPDVYVLTLILGIAALILGIYSYFVTNGNLLSVIGITTSSIPLLFFLFLKLVGIYIQSGTESFWF
jgi:membrane-bound ClpP family serine protease